MSSTRPSAKNSCSGSLLMFWNGSTAIDGLVEARRRRRWLWVFATAPVAPAPDAHRRCDVLERDLAGIREGEVDLAAHLRVHGVGEEHAARRRLAFQSRRDIHAIAENVVAVDDDVAEIDADTKGNRFVIRTPTVRSAIAFCTEIGALHRIDGAGELDQRAVAHHLHDSPAVRGHGRIEESRPKSCGALRACRPRLPPSCGCNRRHPPQAPPPTAASWSLRSCTRSSFRRKIGPPRQNPKSTSALPVEKAKAA